MTHPGLVLFLRPYFIEVRLELIRHPAFIEVAQRLADLHTVGTVVRWYQFGFDRLPSVVSNRQQYRLNSVGGLPNAAQDSFLNFDLAAQGGHIRNHHCVFQLLFPNFGEFLPGIPHHSPPDWHLIQYFFFLAVHHLFDEDKFLPGPTNGLFREWHDFNQLIQRRRISRSDAGLLPNPAGDRHAEGHNESLPCNRIILQLLKLLKIVTNWNRLGLGVFSLIQEVFCFFENNVVHFLRRYASLTGERNNGRRNAKLHHRVDQAQQARSQNDLLDVLVNETRSLGFGHVFSLLSNAFVRASDILPRLCRRALPGHRQFFAD